MTPELLTYAIAGLAFIAVTAVGFVFAGGGNEKQAKRLKAISGNDRGRANDPAALRRQKMQDTVKGLRDKEAARQEKRAVGKTIEDRIRQAGFSFSPTMFHMASGVLGVVAAIGFYVAGFNEGMQLIVLGLAAVGAGLGLPRWALGMAIGMRQKKFVMQFADAIDVIVRGVKSGLPLNECLKVIARESPQPIAGEFAIVVDSLAMGVPLDQALNKMYQRTPIQEVNFFAIVLAIQQKAGGNLSEALGNLSGVLRGRKMLREKIKAFSSEAKASAMIIGSLPIIVVILVYLSTPSYIMSLFITDTGHLILLIAGALMGTGIYIMRSMINFDF